MRRSIFSSFLSTLLLAMILCQGPALAGETPGERKVVDTIRADLGKELAVTRLEAHQASPGAYRIELEANLAGYPSKTRDQVRSLVRQIVVRSLAGLGFELDAESRLRFMEGGNQVAELRGERTLTVVLFMPSSEAPRTVRLSPAATRSLGKNDLTLASAEIASSLGVDPRSTEMLVNTRQVYMRWRRLLATSPDSAKSGLPAVVYARWWGRAPPPPRQTVRRKEKVDPFAHWWAAVQAWHADADLTASSGATVATRGKTTTNGRLVPELQIGAGHYWAGYQKFSHQGNLGGPFTFAGAAFPAGTALSLDLERFQLGGRTSITHHGRNHAEAMAGVDFFVPDARLRSATAVGRLEGLAFGPVFGLSGNLQLAKHFDLAAGLKLPLAIFGRAEVTGFEGEAAVAYRLPGGFEGNGAQLALGYRRIALDIRRGDGNTAANAGAVDPVYGGFFLDFRSQW